MSRAAIVKPGMLLGGRYRMVAQLGRGGMAEVWRGTDERLERRVAVKIFDNDLDDPSSVARQQAEIRALSDLSHPNLVAFYDARHAGSTPPSAGAGDGSGHSYLVMEYVDGPTLGQRLVEGALRPAEVGDIGRGVSAALAAAHSHGMVHRDVKPANILLSKDGGGRTVPKLSDFGIAHRLGAGRITRTAMVVGTAAYLSPEQARGAAIGPPTDVYALGLVLLEALTGRREYEGAPLASAAARLHRPPAVPPGLPAPWPELLTAMTQLDPTARPSASVVLGVLEGRARVPVRVRPAAPARPAPLYVAPPHPSQLAASRAALPQRPAAASAAAVAAQRKPAKAKRPRRPKRQPRSRASGLATVITIVVLIAICAVAIAVLTSSH